MQLKRLQCSLVTPLRNRIQSVSPVVQRRQRKYTQSSPPKIILVTSQPLQELDACIDGAAIPGQPELVDVGASKSVSILMHA